MNDIRFAGRALRKAKAFTVATFLTLALCIGANTALFAVLYSVVLKPLPVSHPERLVFLVNGYPKAGLPRAGSGVPEYVDRLERMKTLEALALYEARVRTSGENGRPERVMVVGVTPSYFRVAGVQPLRGRAFTADEGEPSRNDKAILTYGYWQERFAGAANVLGRELRVDGRAYTIVGIMPKEFRLIEPADARLWIPLAFTAAQKSDANRHNNSWNSVGRLREGTTVQQAQAEVNRLNTEDLERLPAFRATMIRAGFRTLVLPLGDDMVRNVKAKLYLLWGATLLVLLIGCANVVNLTLVRSHARLRELATRLALGAGRLAVARHLLAESLLLTVASGLAGLLLGWASLRLVARFDLRQIPRSGGIALDPAAAGFALGLAVIAGTVMAAFQLVTAYRLNLSAAFHDGGRTGSGGRGARTVRRALVVTQVAIAFVLLVGSCLLVSSFRRILAIDPGFDSTHLLTANVALPAARYLPQPTAGQPQAPLTLASFTRVNGFVDGVVERLKRAPGVVTASVTSSIPMGERQSGNAVVAEGHVAQPGESPTVALRVQATTGYLETLRVPLRQGRYFDARDTAEAPEVVIVDTALAKRLWPGQDPIGRRMHQGDGGPGSDSSWQTVVGVVDEIKQAGLVGDRTPAGVFYFPLSQSPALILSIVVRTVGDPAGAAAEVRKAVAGLDADLPVYGVKTLEQVTDDSLLTRRWPMLLTTAFGGVALLLAGVGLYGVLAYVVTRRTKEIGIRMALGGTPRTICELVLREGLVLLALGVGGGLAGFAALRRVLASQLYGVQPGDPRALAVATGILALIALVACAIPSLRATRIDPVVALNRE